MADYVNKILVYDAGKNRKIGAADNLEIGGNFTAATFYGAATGLTSIPSAQLTGALPALDGSALTDLNGSSINSGTVGASYLPATIAYTDAGATVFSGSLQATTFTGSGSGLTSLPSAELTGALPAIDGSALTSLSASAVTGAGDLSDSVLSANVAKYNDAAPTFTNLLSSSVGFSGNGAQLTDLDADNISSGTVGDSYLSANVAKYTDAAPTFTHTVAAAGFSGDGAALTSLNASNISSGELSDSRLSANVPLLNAGSNTFTGSISATSFSGAGGSLTGLSASNLATGTVNDDRLSANVAKYTDASPTFTNTVAAAGFSGDGSALTNLDADALASGTVADARLSANVALKNAASVAFTGDVTVGGDLTVTGNVYAKEATSVVIGDNFLDLNAGNTITASASAGGLSVSSQAVGTPATGTDFVAGVASTSNPYILTSADPTGDFAAGDMIQVSGSTDGKNDGQFVVLSVSNSPDNRITVKGIGITGTPTYVPFAHTQFVAQTSQTATVTKAIFSVFAASNGEMPDANSVNVPAGRWAQNKGSTEFDFSGNWLPADSASTVSLQTAYNNGGVIELTTAGGPLTIQAASGETGYFNIISNTGTSTIEADAGATIQIGGANGKLVLGGQTQLPGAGLLTTAGPSTSLAQYTVGTWSAGGIVAANAATANVVPVGAVFDDNLIAAVGGSTVRVLLGAGESFLSGEVAYLGSGADAGKAVSTPPASGRVYELGVVQYDAATPGDSTVDLTWMPQYIADL